MLSPIAHPTAPDRVAPSVLEVSSVYMKSFLEHREAMVSTSEASCCSRSSQPLSNLKDQ
ncbi:hypothetical protein FA13DRAFT_1724047 [Coprinellus micaceus]|uniref:Uncharacterized protein n=1 Tax=Coprinellus micaceus TaxID=71717 RepID=A0A4Y7U0P6_COPMI|nr:hypothetical protein FA13DRAFT_1724047 [Coprinellus micaceus]